MRIRNTKFASVLATLLILSIGNSAHADSASTVTQTIEYEDVVVEEENARFVPQYSSPDHAGIGYGPFRVVDSNTVELRGVIDSDTPQQFARMMTEHPGLRLLKMIECPGSEDDDANLRLARMVRRAGMSTFVPATGSIRSGGVELFLAGVRRTAAPGAQIGVHSWRDDDGREANDYPSSDPVHAEYIGFYREMGFDSDRAKAFYSFTNAAAPSSGVYYLSPRDISYFGLTTL